jgi:beta-fructofuranosidase
MEDELARATAAIQAAAPRAQADPSRPTFHVLAPAQWINDPNGPIYHNGFYHLFYQLSPFSDNGGPKYWGHARSRDLVKWETLPIALCPDHAAGEAEVWSGCCTVNGLGQPMIFYTSIAPGKPADVYSDQWAATSDDNMIQWHRSPENPVLSQALHGVTKIYDWRDPFVFHYKKQTFLVAGGNLNHGRGGQAVVNIYEAQNAALTQWKYRGVLFQDPDPAVATAECPNFFQVGDHWVLFLSPYGRVHYFTGDFDPVTCRFHARDRGLLDYGPNFYAPNTMQVPDGRRLVWGWVTGFPGGHGWNGCLSLPRLLSFSSDGKLQQRPAPQLTKLRGQATTWRNFQLADGGQNLPLPKTNALEIGLVLDLGSAKSVAINIKSEAAGLAPIRINISDTELGIMDAKVPAPFVPDKKKLTLRLFIDRSVLEVFAGDTVCATQRIDPLDANPTLELSANGGTATVDRLQAWPMKTIW